MAFVQIQKAVGITKDQYDQVMMTATGGDLGDGELFRVAGGTENDWWVIDGWESREQCDANMAKLMPAFAQAGISIDAMPEPPTEFEIHELRTGP
jgi:hypothetical protein